MDDQQPDTPPPTDATAERAETTDPAAPGSPSGPSAGPTGRDVPAGADGGTHPDDAGDRAPTGDGPGRGGPGGSDGRRPVRRRALVGRIAVVAGLASVAITQPLLDLLGANPEFFVSADLGAREIVLIAVIVAALPTVVLGAIDLGAHAVNRTLGSIVHSVIVGLLFAVFVLALLRLVGVSSTVVSVATAAVAGGAVAWVERASSGVRSFFQLLSLSALAFFGLFLFGSQTSQLVVASGGTGRGTVAVGDTTTPVVMVVLDEFPLTSIMDTEGAVNAERFPNLADLAATSTWFRNASSVFPRTHVALPSMLTGTVTDEDALPIYRDNPRSLFTMLGGAYPISRYEILSDLCPTDLCEARGSADLGESLTDVAIVYGHRVLPTALRERLPSIDGTWGAFGRGGEVLGADAASAPDDAGGDGGSGAGLDGDGSGEAGGRAAGTSGSTATTAPRTTATTSGLDTGSSSAIVEADDPYAKWAALGTEVTGPVGQSRALDELIGGIGPDPALTFIHVTLPHSPWKLTPWGDTNTSTTGSTEDLEHPLIEYRTAQLERRHIMQVGALDELIGRLRSHLRRQSIWDDALVVVTSDHGANFIPPNLWRDLTEENRDDILRIPLFVKLPGQLDGVVRDEPASVIDIVPTIADVLDVETNWSFDGHSLLDGSEPTSPPLVDPSVEPLFERLRLHDERVDRNGDWSDLVAFGPLADLVGTRVTDWTVGEVSTTGVTFDEAGDMAQMTADEPKPYILKGSVTTAEGDDFLVVLNGRIAGIGSGFEESGTGARFSSLVTDAYVEGANDLRAYEVTGSGTGVVLHEMMTDDR